MFETSRASKQQYHFKTFSIAHSRLPIECVYTTYRQAKCITNVNLIYIQTSTVIVRDTFYLCFMVCHVMSYCLFQIQILFTITTGKENKLLDLAVIRLASLNQTLDPWLYILMRRSFLLKVSRTVKRIVCCGESNVDSNAAFANQQTAPIGRHRRVVRNISFKKTFLKYFENVRFVDNTELPQRGNERQSLPDVTKDTIRQVENDLPDVAERTTSCPYCRMKDCSSCSSSSPIHEGIYVTIVLPNPGTITILSKNPKNQRSYITEQSPLSGSDDPLLCSSDNKSFDQNS